MRSLLISLRTFAMAVNSSEEECQSVHSVIVLPEGGTISHAQVPNMMKIDVCLSSEPNLQTISSLKMDNSSSHVPSILDADIEKGKAEISIPKEDSVDILKSDNPLAKALHREIRFRIGGKFMQFFLKYFPELLKFSSKDKVIPERVHDISTTNRSRKYKRSHSFNSRRVVLLFSVLSSIGSIILIYLTLRVRQIAVDGSTND